MKIFQYMRVHHKYVPQEIIDAYGLTNEYFDSKGYVYLEIREGMYGLKEASILAYHQLKEHLAQYGYAPVRFTPGLWKHNTRHTTFTLAVNDFGIKYFCKDDADHLFSALHDDKYELTKDWTGTSYLGLTLKWNYDAGCVDISMPTYVSKALARFQHTHPKSAQHAPHQWSQPVYGQKVQYANTDTSPLLNKTDTQRVQYFSIMREPSIQLSYRLSIKSPSTKLKANHHHRPSLRPTHGLSCHLPKCDHLLLRKRHDSL
jgi:hypothetical protein